MNKSYRRRWEVYLRRERIGEVLGATQQGRMRSRHPALQARRAESEPARSAPYLALSRQPQRKATNSRGGRL
jgi:hypothetical protein